MACSIRNPGKFCSWSPEPWALESRIQLKESGIPIRIGIQNPSFIDKGHNFSPSSVKTQHREPRHFTCFKIS